MKKWIGYHFESSCYTTEEFKAFARDLKKCIKKKLLPGEEIVNWNRGHFYVSGFIKKNDKYVYFSIPDVRGYEDWSRVLIRTAKNEKDYTGGMNNYTSLDKFAENIQPLLAC